MSSLHVPEVEEIDAMTPAELEAGLRELDRQRRQLEAAIATYVRRTETTGAYLADGHRHITAWAKATCNWSTSEATRATRLGRLLARFPTAGTACQNGSIGVAQLHALASLVANPRVGEHLDDGEAILVEQAMVLDHDDYHTFLTQWQAAADANGTHARHERAHTTRSAHLSIIGERFVLDAHGGVAHGTQLRQVLDAFTHTEWLADWDAGVAEHGTRMCPNLMARNNSQRRHDALLAIFRQAAAASTAAAGAGAGGYVVNLIVGHELFEHQLISSLGATPPPLNPNNPHHRCETDDGTAIDPHDMLIAAALGHVRRVVLDSAGVVTDMGRKQRLFTGALRDAVMLANRRCTWPGCNRPTAQCEADHTLPYSHAGPTTTHNGGPQCGPHNRWKSNGYRTWRDPHGHWHHYRPNGTEIGWRCDQPQPQQHPRHADAGPLPPNHTYAAAVA
jgi:hypothetical protein